MTLIVKDRVQESSTTTGTGALTLAGAITGYRTFASVMTSPSDTAYYAIVGVDANGVPSGEWETGLGTYSAANTLTRTTVLASSNAGAAVNFSSGTKRVFIDLVAARVVLAELAQSWTGVQTFTAPVLGTPASGNLANCTGYPGGSSLDLVNYSMHGF